MTSTTKKPFTGSLPNAVKYSGRGAMGIEYFETEEDAEAAARIVTERGDKYHGGWYHGEPCGRESDRDYVDKETGKKLYAVTTR
jgi:hypothetical protein